MPGVLRVAGEDSAKPLRIAMVAPTYFPVPPTGYGGVEIVIADLIEGLVDLGHHVTLLAAGVNGTSAQAFIALQPTPSADGLGDALPEVTQAARVLAALGDAGEFDVVHDHTLAGPLLAAGRACPTVVTVHGPVTGDAAAYYSLSRSADLVAISASQRGDAPELPWLDTVHNGIAVDTFPYRVEKEDFALFIGRFHPDKGAHHAIDACREAGRPLVMAGKCSEPIELDYWKHEIEPRMGLDVVMAGVAGPARKRDLYSRASCVLFPSDWNEPFGLVMVEAMACGTPVVALNRGAVPEVLVNGVTGYVVDEPAELGAALRESGRIDPAACRHHAESRFGIPSMARGYGNAYQAAIGRRVAIAQPTTPLVTVGT